MTSTQSAGDSSLDVENALACLQLGDQVEIGQLLDVYRGYLLKIAAESLSSGIIVKAAPSDIVQETMLRASQSIPEFRGKSELEFREWLKQILLNKVTDEERKFLGAQKRDLSREFPLQGDPPEAKQRLGAESPPIRSPLSGLVEKEASLFVHEALRRLTEEESNVLKLRIFEKKGFHEIGKCLGCSAEAARKRWTRAVKSFHDELHKHAPSLFGTE